MIDLRMTGVCHNCNNADLVLRYSKAQEEFSGCGYYVECKYEHVCERVEQHTIAAMMAKDKEG